MISASSGAYGLSLIVWYLAPGSSQQGESGPVCESPMEEVVGHVGSGLVGLPLRGTLKD